MGEEGHARVREHANQRRGEAAVKVDEAGAGGRRRRCGQGRESGGLFVVDLRADGRERRARVEAGFKREPHADDLQRVGEEYGGDAGKGTADQAAQGCFLSGGTDYLRADLLVCEEFDGRVGEYAEEGC